MARRPERFEVYLVQLDPAVGREIQKSRPCVVVSPDEINRQLDTVLVVPLTTKGRAARFRPAVKFRGQTGLLLPEQMRSVDRARFVRRLGRLDAQTGKSLLLTLQHLFAP